MEAYLKDMNQKGYTTLTAFSVSSPKAFPILVNLS